jgi:hypothetical protein
MFTEAPPPEQENGIGESRLQSLFFNKVHGTAII